MVLRFLKQELDCIRIKSQITVGSYLIFKNKSFSPNMSILQHAKKMGQLICLIVQFHFSTPSGIIAGKNYPSEKMINAQNK